MADVVEVPQVVIDSNIVLDWLVFHDPRVAALAAALTKGMLIWLVCPRMVEELGHVWRRTALARWAPDSAVLAAALERHGHRVDDPPAAPPPPGWRCRDQDDQVFLDLARAHHAQALFSRDRALLKLARKAAAIGLQITEPERWT
ncbi:MAG: hypothetical protein RL722_1177, partial [Pseudomonadota bacterium]